MQTKSDFGISEPTYTQAIKKPLPNTENSLIYNYDYI